MPVTPGHGHGPQVVPRFYLPPVNGVPVAYGAAAISGAGAVTATASDAGAAAVSGTSTLTEAGAEFEGFATAGQSSLTATAADGSAFAASGAGSIGGTAADQGAFATSGSGGIGGSGGTSGGLALSGASAVGGTGADQGAASVAGGSDITGTGTGGAAAGQPMVYPDVASMLGLSVRREFERSRREGRSITQRKAALGREIDRLLEEDTESRPKKKRTRTAREQESSTEGSTQGTTAPSRPLQGTGETSLTAPPQERSTAPESAGYRFESDGRKRPVVSAASVGGDTQLVAGVAVAGRAVVVGGSWVSGAGMLDWDNSEDEMDALAMALA